MVREIRRVKRVRSYRAPRSPVPQGAVLIRPMRPQKRLLAVSESTQAEAELERRAVPATQVYGTILERIVYKALTKRRIPFSFQSSLVGGRTGWMFGRQVADFALWQQAIVIECQGAYWHSQREQKYRDITRELVLSAKGWTVLYLEEDTIKNEQRLNRWLEANVVFGKVGSTGWSMPTSISGDI